MSERKLRSRKRIFSKGRALRVSDLVYETLDAGRRLGGTQRSFDAYFRRILGLPTRDGRTQRLIEGMLEATTGVFVLKLADATWTEVETVAFRLAHAAAERKRLRTHTAPIKMREMR